MESLENFLTFHIERLTADQGIPVDPLAVAAKIGAVVEEREMIPEAAMAIMDGHFHIYVQGNFSDMPGVALRKRFSLAHEIGHTLFYEERNGQLKSRKDAPKGNDLEAACQRAAAMILIPDKALRSELRQKGMPNAATLVDFANRFQVSTEAMARRLHELACFETGWVPVLTRDNGQAVEIEYAPYPPWLRSHLGKPRTGVRFARWFGPSDTSNGILRRNVSQGILEARPLQVSKSKIVYELQLHVL